MAQNNETRIPKTSTFEEWRQSSNEVSFDLGPVGSNNDKTATSLDTESRLTDQLKSVSQAGGTIATDDEFIEDNNIRIDYAPDKKIDMTAGYIILEGQTTLHNSFAIGSTIDQYVGDTSSGTRTFRAKIVSIKKTGSAPNKILVSNVTGIFDASKALGPSASFNTNKIAASKIIRKETGSMNHGYVRVYKTNSGTTTKLTQSTTDANGFHIPRATHSITFSSSITIPTTYTEGETIFQGTNLASATFSAKILFITTAKVVLYDVGGSGSYSGSVDFKSATNTSNTIPNAKLPSSLTTIDQSFSKLIRLNTPCASGDTFEIFYGSSVDAIRELQDDIGTIENFSSFNAAFGMSGTQNNMSGSTDIELAITKIQNIIGNTTLPSHTTNFTAAANNNTITGAVENIMTFVGNTALSTNALGATTDNPTTLTAAVLGIKNFIGTTDISAVTTGEKITDSIAQLHAEIGSASFARDLPSEHPNATAFNAGAQNLTAQIDDISRFISSTSLGTTHNTTITGAINELETNIRGSLGNYTISDHLHSGVTYVRNNGIIDALNDVTDFIGNTTINGVGDANKITSAIKKLHDELGPAHTLNSTVTAFDSSSTDGIGGFRNTHGGTEATIVSALTELRQAIVGNTAHLPDSGTAAREASDIDATLANAIADLDDATGYTHTNIIDAILEIQKLVGNVTTLTSNHFDANDLALSLIELKEAVVGSVDIDTAVGFLNDDAGGAGGGTDFNTTNLVAAVREIQTDIGPLSTAVTAGNGNPNITNFTQIQSALVNLLTLIGAAEDWKTIQAGSSDTLVGSLHQLHTEIGDKVFANDLPSQFTNATAFNNSSQTLTKQIDDIAGFISSTSLTTTHNTTITGAINELHTEIGGENITTISGSNNSITGALVQLHTELGDVAALDGTSNLSSSVGGYASEVVTNNFDELRKTIAGNNVIATKKGTLNTHTAFTSTDIITAITEIQGKLRASGGSNVINAAALGTTAGTITEAIREIHDEHGVLGSLNTTAQGNFVAAINEVHDNALMLDETTGTQTIASNVSMTSGKTLTIPSGAILDVSAGTLKVASSATADFEVSGSKILFADTAGETASNPTLPITGVGMKVDRSTLADTPAFSSVDAEILWIDKVGSGDSFETDSANRGWHIRGITDEAGGNNGIGGTASGAGVTYTAPIVDFFNAKHLIANNTESGIAATWDAANRNFDFNANDFTITLAGDLTGNVTITDLASATLTATIGADKVALGTNTTGDYIETATGTANQITVAGSGTEGRDITLSIPDSPTISSSSGTLTVPGRAVFQKTGGGDDSCAKFEGNVQIAGALKVDTGGTSITQQTTAVESGEIILANTRDTVVNTATSAMFIVNRGFSSSNTTANLAVAGKRYKIVSGAADSPATSDLRTIGASANTAGVVFKATGPLTNGTPVIKEQLIEAKIAFDETEKQFILYRGTSDTAVVSTDTTTAAIIAQGDTIGSATKFTVATNSTNSNRQVLFMEADGTSSLMRDGGLLYNPSTNAFTVQEGSATTVIDNSGGNTFHNNITVEDSVNTGTNRSARSVNIKGQNAQLKLQETDVTNTPEWGLYADGGNLSVRLNNVGSGTYPLQFTTNGANNDIDSVDINEHLNITATHALDVNGNATVDGTLDHNGLFTQALAATNLVGSCLGKDATNTKTGASFDGRVGNSASGINKLLIQDVRISTETNNAARDSDTAAKRLLFNSSASDMSFIDFQGSGTNTHEIRLGGLAHSLIKTYVKGQSDGATELYHNSSISASDKKLETAVGGVNIYGDLTGATNITASSEIQGGTLDINGAASIAGAVTDVTSLQVDNIKIDSSNIGLTTDTDLITLGSNQVTVAGTVSSTGLLMQAATAIELDVKNTSTADSTGDSDSGNAVAASHRERFLVKNTGSSLSATPTPVILAQSAGLDEGNVGFRSMQAQFSNKSAADASGNTLYTRIFTVRDSAGSSWNEASMRLQFGVDSTDMGYLAANKNADYGLELGSGGEAFIQMVKNAQVDIKYDNVTKLSTTSTGVLVSGSSATNGKLSTGTILFTDADNGVRTSQSGIRRNSSNAIHLDTLNSFIVNLDTNNDNTDAQFEIRKDDADEPIFTVEENADVKFYHYDDADDSSGGSSPTVGMIWDSNATRLGVGTDSPSVPLDVAGNAKVTGTFTVSGANATILGGTLAAADDISTSVAGKKLKAFGGGSDYATLYHDGAGGHIDSNDKFEIASSTIQMRTTNGGNLLFSGNSSGTILYHDNTSIIETSATGITVNGTNGVTAKKFKFPVLGGAQSATADGSFAFSDFGSIEAKKISTGGETSALDFIIGDNFSNTDTSADKFRFRFNPSGSSINSGNPYSLVEIFARADGSTRMDLTKDSLGGEVIATTFTGALSGNATTATTLATSRNITIDNVNHGFDGSANIDLTEAIRDTVGKMFTTSNTETNITATHQDVTNDIDLVVADATASVKGAASFSASDFSVSSGAVSIKSSGVSNTQLAGSIALTKLANVAANSLIGNNTGNAAAPGVLSAQQVRTLLGFSNPNSDGGGTNYSSTAFADNYGQWRFRVDTDPTEEVNSLDTVTFQTGDNVTLERTGQTLKISSTDNDTQYTAHGGSSSATINGIYLTASNQFRIAESIKPNTNQFIGSSDNTQIYFAGGSGDGGAPQGSIQFYNSGIENMRLEPSADGIAGAGIGLEVNGDITAFSTALSSDIKLKENVVVVNGALEKVSQLEGVTFDWKKNGKSSAGVIAQNVEEVMPELVSEATGLNETEAHKVVDYNGLSALFIEAIKELKDQNELLRAEIEELKANK